MIKVSRKKYINVFQQEEMTSKARLGAPELNCLQGPRMKKKNNKKLSIPRIHAYCPLLLMTEF